MLLTEDLEAAMRVLAHGTRTGNETHHETIQIMFSAMTGSDVAEEIWSRSTAYYRETLRRVAEHLDTRGLLDPGLDVDAAADRLWFCFGITAWRTLVTDCGWTYDEAEQWLRRQAVGMLGDPARV